MVVLKSGGQSAAVASDKRRFADPTGEVFSIRTECGDLNTVLRTSKAAFSAGRLGMIRGVVFFTQARHGRRIG